MCCFLQLSLQQKMKGVFVISRPVCDTAYCSSIAMHTWAINASNIVLMMSECILCMCR